MISIPGSGLKELDCWVAVPKSVSMDEGILFAGSVDLSIKTCEESLPLFCFHLDTGQRCADWFILSQVRVTGTIGSTILQHNQDFLSYLGRGIDSARERIMAKWFSLYFDSCFSLMVSTEAMQRGRANELAVLKFISSIFSVMAVSDVGMLGLVDNPDL